jgi:molecular chaperone DnaK (HSP70)
MPMVVNWVKKMSGSEPLRGINVDEAVCFGAAIQAQMEMNARSSYKIGGATSPGQKYTVGGMNVVDVMSHSLGLVAVNADSTKYINSIIIPKNLPIPSSQKRPYQFKTRPGNPNELDVYLTQGEVEDVSKCIIVSKYVFEGIEHLTTGKTVIDIEYQYDSNGIITVFGKQRETGCDLTAQKCPLPDDMSWLYRKPEFAMPHLSVILAIDLSWSMEGSPLKKAIEAAQNFVDKIDLTNASVGLLVFADKEKILCPLTQNSKEISNGIKEIIKVFKENDKTEGKIIGFGNQNNPLAPCHNLLSSRESPRYMIILTDGVWEHPNSAIQTKQLFVKDEMDIIAIGFGGADKKFLEAISTSSEHAIFTTANNLTGTFSNIAQELTEGGGGLRKK